MYSQTCELVMNFGKFYGLWLHLSRQFTKACKLVQVKKAIYWSKIIVLLYKNHSTLFGILLIIVFSKTPTIKISRTVDFWLPEICFPFGPGISLINKNQ